jgi:hypothetical protein
MCQKIRFFSKPAALFGRPLWGTSEKTEKQAGRSDRRDEGSKPTRRARVRPVTETQGEKHLPRGTARCRRVRMPNDPAARQPSSLLEGSLGLSLAPIAALWPSNVASSSFSAGNVRSGFLGPRPSYSGCKLMAWPRTASNNKQPISKVIKGTSRRSRGSVEANGSTTPGSPI